MTIKQRAVEEVQNFLQYGMTFYEAQSEAIRLVKRQDRTEGTKQPKF